MKLWIDENMHSHVIKALKQAGHEIRMAKRGTDDIPILISAMKANAVIITQDKDFERLVLKEGRPCTGIILIRLAAPNRIEELTAKLVRLINVRATILTTSFVTLSLDGANIKRLK